MHFWPTFSLAICGNGYLDDVDMKKTAKSIPKNGNHGGFSHIKDLTPDPR